MNDKLRWPRDALALGPFSIDLEREDLFDAAGQRVPLRRQALAVLLELARHAGAVCSHKALADAVWQRAHVTDDSLVQCIGEIRRVLGAPTAALIKTVARRGYVLDVHPMKPRAHDAALSAPHATASCAPAAPAGLPFVGRGAELDELVTRSCRPDAPGCLVLITGEPGIGKSRLVEESAQAAAREGAAPLVLKCHEIEAGIAYGALSQIAERLVSLADAADLQSLDAVSRAELAALVPWCAAKLEPLAELSETDAGLRQARLRAAFVALCAAASRRHRLILCVDDAHWLDDASATALFAAAKAAREGHYAIWATLRRDEIAQSPHAQRLVDALLELPHASRLELARLNADDVRSIVAQLRDHRSTSPAQVDRWVRESAGNPFYLSELMRAGRDGGNEAPPANDGVPEARILPAGILDAVLRRARHLPPPAQRLLEAAAVLDQSAAFDVLCHVAGQEGAAALDTLGTLLAAGWLVEERDRPRYVFAHDKLREAIHASLSAATACSLHGRAARALLSDARRRREAPEHAVVAAHAQRAGEALLALEQFALAGDEARRMFELRRAEALYTQALTFERGAHDAKAASTRVALLEKRGALRSMLGAEAQAEADLRGAIALAQAHFPGEETDGHDHGQGNAALLRLHIELGVMLQRHHRLEDAHGVLRQGLALAQAANHAESAAAAHCWLGDVEWMLEHNRAARTHFEAVLAGITPAGAPAGMAAEAARTKALFGLAQCAGMDARPSRADELLDQAFARSQSPAELFLECAWHVLKGWVRIGSHGMGEPEAARDHFERCLEVSRRAELFWYAVPCNIGLGVVHGMAGRFDEATALLESVLRLPADAHNDRWRLSAGVWLASCHLERGDPAAALRVALQAQGSLGQAGPFMFAAKLPALVTTARVRLGYHHECDDPQPLIDEARRNEVGYAVIAGLQARAEWLCARGDTAQLRACADELEREATDRGLPQAHAAAMSWRARAPAV